MLLKLVLPNSILKYIPGINVVIFDYIKEKTILNNKVVHDKSEVLKLINRIKDMANQNQGYRVCQKAIGSFYAKNALRLGNDGNDLHIIVFEETGKTELRRRGVFKDKLLGFVSCSYHENNENNEEANFVDMRELVKRIHIKLICVSADQRVKGLGSSLMKYIYKYANHYNINVVSLEAATIELACNFYNPKFGFNFNDKKLNCKSLRRPRLRNNKNEHPLARFPHNRMFNMSRPVKLSRKLTRRVKPPTRYVPESFTPKKKTTTQRPYKHKYYTRSSRKPPNTKLKSKLKRKGTKV